VSIGCAANSPENRPCTDAGQPRRKCAALRLSAEFATAIRHPALAVAGRPAAQPQPKSLSV